MSSLRLNILAVVLIAVLFFLQYRLWFAADGVKDLVKLKQALAGQKAENETLKKHNEELLFQIQRLQNGHDEAEARARNELGMIKKDEVFYQIVN